MHKSCYYYIVITLKIHGGITYTKVKILKTKQLIRRGGGIPEMSPTVLVRFLISVVVVNKTKSMA